jgi:hypothetical protein
MKGSVKLFVLCGLLATGVTNAQTPPHRRALLVGINDYTASKTTTTPHTAAAPGRDWPNLSGAVNDVNAMGDMLVILYGFDRKDIVTLTDQAATREAILSALEHLGTTASKDDVILFYYAGHGSQVRNSLSDEADKMDESIVAADSRAGAEDIRDKVLRACFNRILDRGARLTVMLDNCHSGSGARGLGTGARPRGVKPDLRDVADRVTGPRPEERGALVLAASEDFGNAWETRDAEGTFHGEFSWAWIRAMRDAADGEPASQTFLRAEARMRSETPFQQPVMSGTKDVRTHPFLGTGAERHGDHIVVAVEKVQHDGTVILQGGWTNGLSVGTELRDPASTARLTVTALRGVAESEAHVQSPGVIPHFGALLEVTAWAAPPGRPLRIWAPRTPSSMKEIAALARALAAEAAQHGVRWITDPIDATPTHLLRWGGKEWELLSDGGDTEPVGQDGAAIGAVAKLATGSTLFVQFPAPRAMVDAVAAEGVVQADSPRDADYMLVGRFGSRRLSFAWLRPSVKKADRRKIGLPLQTGWVAEPNNDNRLRNSIPILREALLRLRAVHAWHFLESPPAERFPYRLSIRRARDGELLPDDSFIIGDEKYELVMTSSPPFSANLKPRYIYVFVIDSYGKSTLLFPHDGSVENRFPPSPPPAEIPFGEAGAFEATTPYGVDTYFLLATEEPLPDPWILEHHGVRASHPQTPLETLLTLTASGTRSISIATPSKWSITKATYESLPPHTTKAAK